jgi:hypothetical protein
MKKVLWILCLLTLVVSAYAEPLLKKGEKAVLWESFEGKLKWLMAKGEANDSSLEIKSSTAFATEGKTSLEGKFKMNGKNGATYYVDSIKQKDRDWSGYKGVAFDVKNASPKDIEVVFAVQTGDDWAWQESATVSLKANAVTKDIRFDFFTDKLKSEATGWQFAASLKNAGLIQKFLIKFFGPVGTEGAVYIDNIRFIK